MSTAKGHTELGERQRRDTEREREREPGSRLWKVFAAALEWKTFLDGLHGLALKLTAGRQRNDS